MEERYQGRVDVNMLDYFWCLMCDEPGAIKENLSKKALLILNFFIFTIVNDLLCSNLHNKHNI